MRAVAGYGGLLAAAAGCCLATGADCSLGKVKRMVLGRTLLSR